MCHSYRNCWINTGPDEALQAWPLALHDQFSITKFLPLVFLGFVMHVHQVPSVCLFSPVWLFVTLWTVASQLLCPWNSSDKNTRVDCHVLLQGMFLTQGSNPCVLSPPALTGRFFTTSTTWEAGFSYTYIITLPIIQKTQTKLINTWKIYCGLIQNLDMFAFRRVGSNHIWLGKLIHEDLYLTSFLSEALC